MLCEKPAKKWAGLNVKERARAKKRARERWWDKTTGGVSGVGSKSVEKTQTPSSAVKRLIAYKTVKGDHEEGKDERIYT